MAALRPCHWQVHDHWIVNIPTKTDCSIRKVLKNAKIFPHPTSRGIGRGGQAAMWYGCVSEWRLVTAWRTVCSYMWLWELDSKWFWSHGGPLTLSFYIVPSMFNHSGISILLVPISISMVNSAKKFSYPPRVRYWRTFCEMSTRRSNIFAKAYVASHIQVEISNISQNGQRTGKISTHPMKQLAASTKNIIYFLAKKPILYIQCFSRKLDLLGWRFPPCALALRSRCKGE